MRKREESRKRQKRNEKERVKQEGAEMWDEGGSKVKIQSRERLEGERQILLIDDRNIEI